VKRGSGGLFAGLRLTVCSRSVNLYDRPPDTISTIVRGVWSLSRWKLAHFIVARKPDAECRYFVFLSIMGLVFSARICR
jgi:hypothetical protein